jgi:hypothetical protein
VWFAQAESQFFLAGISGEKTKFCHVISQLDQRYAAQPLRPNETELMRQLSPSREQLIRQLLTLEMCDRKATQFLRHLRSLAPDVPDDFLHTIWSSRLLPNIQAILIGRCRCAVFPSSAVTFILTAIHIC